MRCGFTGVPAIATRLGMRDGRPGVVQQVWRAIATAPSSWCRRRSRWWTPEREPHTVLAARHNLAIFLQEAGRAREALVVLAPRPLALRRSSAIAATSYRLRWLEGSLARDIGEFRLAEEAFEEAYRGFIEESPL